MAKKVAPKTKEDSKVGKPSTRLIKACGCTKTKEGKPLLTRNFTATPFKGEACEECFKVMSFEPIVDEEPQEVVSQIDEREDF